MSVAGWLFELDFGIEGRTDCKSIGPRCADLDGGIGTLRRGCDRNSRGA